MIIFLIIDMISAGWYTASEFFSEFLPTSLSLTGAKTLPASREITTLFQKVFKLI